jgi:hypothetical protein
MIGMKRVIIIVTMIFTASVIFAIDVERDECGRLKFTGCATSEISFKLWGIAYEARDQIQARDVENNSGHYYTLQVTDREVTFEGDSFGSFAIVVWEGSAKTLLFVE